MIGDIIQPTHLLFILVVALIVLGPKRLPEVGRSLGRGLRDFRSGMQGVESEARGVFRDALEEPDLSEPSGLEEVTPAVAAPEPHFVVSPGPATASVAAVTGAGTGAEQGSADQSV